MVGRAGKKLDVKYWPKEDILAQLAQAKGERGSSGYSATNELMEKTFRESQLSIIKEELPEQMDLDELTDVKPMGLDEYLQLWWGQ